MNILCYNIEKGLMEAIAMKLLPRGYQLYIANDDFELKKFLYSKGIQLIISDITGKKNKDDINLQFLEWLKNVDENNSFRKIVISGVTDEYSIRRLVDLGITSFISKKNSTQVILERVEVLISKMHLGKPDSRKHVRVTPEESENPSAMFYLGKDKIDATIVNVSMGGVLLKVEGMGNLNQVRKDSILPRLQLTINNKKIIGDTVVVAKKDNFLGLRYSSMNDTYKEALSRYIFSKISHT